MKKGSAYKGLLAFCALAVCLFVVAFASPAALPALVFQCAIDQPKSVADVDAADSDGRVQASDASRAQVKADVRAPSGADAQGSATKASVTDLGELAGLHGSALLDAGGEYAFDEVMVQLPDDVSADELVGLLRDAGCTQADEFDVADVADVALGWAKLTLPEGVELGQALDVLDEAGFAAQPNYVYHLLEEGADQGESPLGESAVALDDAPGLSVGQIESEPSAVSTQAVSVNDPYANKVTSGASWLTNYWWMRATGLFDAWGTQATSGDVTVAIVDSGCDVGHEDFSSSKIVAAWNVLTENSNVQDRVGHGTHVAGIVAATANNGKGVAGVSYDARIMPICIMDSKGSTSTSYLLEACQYVMKNAKAYNVRVMNMSIGGSGGYDSAVLRAIDKAYYEYGILTVTAAGNSGSAPEDEYGNPIMPYYCFPCDYSEVNLGVINVEDADGLYGDWTNVARNDTSNYNKGSEKTKDLSAPGTDIASTWPFALDGQGDGWRLESGYAMMTGTSMATPVVSGVAALVFAANPSLTPGEVKSVLCTTAQDIAYKSASETAVQGFDRYTGYGLVRADEAVASAEGGYLEGLDAVAVGKTITLSVPSGRTGEWKWKSLDAGVATVNGAGVVQGVSHGEAVISATRVGGGAEGESTGPDVLYRTIVVYETSIEGASVVPIGGSVVLSLETGTLAMCEWSTSDASIAKVNKQSGKVVGVKAGTVTITATLTAAPHIKVTKKVTVKPGIYDAVATLSKTSLVFNGKVRTPKVTSVVNDGKKLVEGTDYKVTYAKGRKYVGTYSVLIKGIGAYTGLITKKFTIKKAANPLAIKTVAMTASAQQLKTASVKLARPISYTRKAKGAVTYAKVASRSSSRLSINKKGGKVTVAKGTVPGVYKIRIKVRAAGTSNYKPCTRIVTATVRVK